MDSFTRTMSLIRYGGLFLPLLMLAACATHGPNRRGVVELFNGRDLKGWVQHGGRAKFRVEDGQIVGSSVTNTPNSFLCTEHEFSNFILDLDFKVQDGLNSGIQIRSRVFDHATELVWNGRAIKVPAGRVHGYQIEIDPSERAWTGGLYEEGRRGWLNDLKGNASARSAFKHDEWNHFRIEAKGPSIKTWINGVPAADFVDHVTPSGFIGLQVHGVGKREKELEIRFRNIQLKPLP